MLYSRPCEYAIRATTYLARQRDGELVPVSEIARAERITLPFLSRILYDLARNGLLESRKGPGGGFRLARPARQIKLRDIVDAVDGLAGLERCATGLSVCSDEIPCPLHDSWKDLRRRIKAQLERVSLAQMARAVERKKALLAAR